jgi:DNA-binding transcriptional ArsR family regulator
VPYAALAVSLLTGIATGRRFQQERCRRPVDAASRDLPADGRVRPTVDLRGRREDVSPAGFEVEVLRQPAGVLVAEPPYRAISAALRERILAGEWLPGEQIPSVRQLSEQFGVSIGTARRALVVLRDEGLITVTPSWGAFIPE